MPKELTHWMLAERALACLPSGSRLQGTIAQHRHAYLGGAVLPDTLAHIFRGPFHPTARVLGHRFHDAAGNSYAPLIRAERHFPDGIPPALLSCFLGVICHMEADMALHPYVYAATGSAGIGEHYRLETGIDLHFVKSGAAPAQRRLDRLLCSSTKEVMVSAAGFLFDPEGELPRRALEHSLALHCRFQAMYDRAFWKLAVRVLGRLCGSPFREQRHLFYPLRAPRVGVIGAEGAGKWRHPESGEIRSDSIDELARQAVERTVAVFRRIEAAGTLAAALGSPPGANLLTGLHGVGKGMTMDN
ncbi:MAG: hypothetical protein A2075_02545 [Geobacteraceae bacterium GWC2_58_44]|nr:MAG: hypothetical protein A2075_02545 [Geobacteraceae bacterium GWC2_58_44]HBG04012.1 hypothetical protein [Geobacter sp.]